MEGITRIDLLVHPFFGFHLNERMPERHLNGCSDTYTSEEADLLMKLWTNRINQIKEADAHALLFVSLNLRNDNFECIKKGREGRSYEAKLLEYAYSRLEKGPLLFFHNTLNGKDLTPIKKGLAKEVIVYVYGEWIGSCCIGEAEMLSKQCSIPKKQFRLLPKLSVDRSGRYPPPWTELSAKKMTREQKEAIRMQLKKYTERLERFKNNRGC